MAKFLSHVALQNPGLPFFWGGGGMNEEWILRLSALLSKNVYTQPALPENALVHEDTI
jgi:hypothetical protein